MNLSNIYIELCDWRGCSVGKRKSGAVTDKSAFFYRRQYDMDLDTAWVNRVTWITRVKNESV